MIINDITLNFLDKFYPFYEWLDDDNIESFEKVFVYKVRPSILQDLINNVIKIDLKYLKDIPLIFTDEYEFIAIDFDKKGKSNYKSSLTLKDQIKISNLIYYVKYENINYEKIKQVDQSINLRYEEKIKKVLSLEINKLYENNNTDKIKYIYYEWFKCEEDNIKKIINKMQKKLLLPITNDEKKLYNLIIKTYKVV
ncbi:MAG: hypothetical protein PUD07_00835 [bacterium]|nr:hypothetical protein [bacterium]